MTCTHLFIYFIHIIKWYTKCRHQWRDFNVVSTSLAITNIIITQPRGLIVGPIHSMSRLHTLYIIINVCLQLQKIIIERKNNLNCSQTIVKFTQTQHYGISIHEGIDGRNLMKKCCELAIDRSVDV